MTNKKINFYSVIIGTELLNGRRKDVKRTAKIAS